MSTIVNEPSWHATPNDWQLATSALTGRLALAHPEQGLVEARSRGAATGAERLFAVGFGAAESLAPLGRLADSYVRGDDLVATYENSLSESPFRVQIYWRVLRDRPVVDWQISVQTSRLETHPRLACQSVWTAPFEAVQYRESAGAWTPCVDGPAAVGSGTVVLVRPFGGEDSHLLMIHPSDNAGVAWTGLPNSAASTGRKLTHQLFDRPLEKGVILRARLRWELLPRDDDEDRAVASFAGFLAAPLPLTT